MKNKAITSDFKNESHVVCMGQHGVSYEVETKQGKHTFLGEEIKRLPKECIDEILKKGHKDCQFKEVIV